MNRTSHIGGSRRRKNILNHDAKHVASTAEAGTTEAGTTKAGTTEAGTTKAGITKNIADIIESATIEQRKGSVVEAILHRGLSI